MKQRKARKTKHSLFSIWEARVDKAVKRKIEDACKILASMQAFRNIYYET